jgi:hypothetical protein
MSFWGDEDEFDIPHPLVWLHDEQVWGTIIKYGAYASVVEYTKDGHIFQVIVENDDIE